MDSDDTTDDSSRNLMHQTNDIICIRENAKVTQHDPEFENANGEDNIEAPHRPIISVNIKKTYIFQGKNLLEGRTRTWPRPSFDTLDSNCPKQ